MISNYIKIAWRNAVNNKVFSFINIFGLSIGLTCCLLISMYLFKEFSYDRQHALGNRLYQVGTLSIMEGKEDRFATTPAPLGPTMQQEFAEVESTVRLLKAFQDDKTLFQYKAGKDIHSFYETSGYFADPTFFRLFSYQFKEGNPETALNEPNSVVISEDIAHKIFGNELALNKTVHINSNTSGAYDFKVTGVFIPSKTPSHIDARFVMSMQSGEVGPWLKKLDDLANNNLFYTYLLLKQGAKPKALEVKFDPFIQKYAGKELQASGRGRKHFLIPVKDIHLYANTGGNVTPGGSVSYLYLLFSIAIVTLLIACVNFMNLSTARSSKRAVEIGVRKVLGAEKIALVQQFLWEAILLSLLAFVVSLVMTTLLMPLFEQVAGKDFTFSIQQYVLLISGFLLITLIAGIIAGIYPAFYLSAFKPVKVLKGRFSNSLSAISFRKVLVVFQFVISVALVVASITISNQMRYLRNKDLGFQKEQQIVIPLRTSTAKQIYPSLKNSLNASSSISSSGASIFYPGIDNVMDWLMYRQGDASDNTKQVFMNRVDDSYLQTLGIQLVAGRLFSKEFPGDTANRIILNEQALHSFGFKDPEDAIGKNLIMAWAGREMLYPIVGVVKNFHFEGLYTKIGAYGFLLGHSRDYGYMIAHAKTGNIKTTLSSIGTAWSTLNPNEPFEYSFLDQDFQKNYIAEERLAALIRYFTVIAIFISCLGLFGLTTFSIEQRTKEIGIRKVLGASVAGIVSLLSKDFLKLVVISFLVASPLAWYFINQWLQGFAYKTPFTIWIVLAGCLVAFSIAFLTISIQAIKAAIANPVKNLRTE
ncbi:ABC transporter permease [Chitinophagaceae bacterium LB-8]|uniref:ABC transporter permease n=1 Tax=Paraflavisolibacter caeni TaxID=2982496 RepID=A0A9X3BGX5_9BACT|nr:ABC transporter permease [Paraflavisolibacter caeni]MCU7548572.1 ABC transporter permease [Paraflavisolibacter caeni]